MSTRLTRQKTAIEINAMRESGRMLASVLQTVAHKVSPDVSTKYLADIAARELKHLGGKPAFLGYQGYPDVMCVSLNDEVVHGIPKSNKIIKEGDIVSLDFGVTYQNMITDAAISIIAGSPLNPEHAELVKVTEASLMAGINEVQDGVHTGDIGAAIEKVLSAHNYGIVRDLVGHGVGDYLHEEPNIPNYGRKNTGTRLKQGMTIAIEPMATLGDYHVHVLEDGWTVVVADHSLSAHFEHTVLITDSGAEILTQL